jgi:hypothetical protein
MIFSNMIGSRQLDRTRSVTKLPRLPQGKTGKARTPGANVVTSSVPDAERPKRLGFMAGKGSVPDDFDLMCQDDIIRLFEGES